MMNPPAQMMAADTWMISHQLFNAGTSCALSVYSTVTASPSVNSTAPVTKTPIQRTSLRSDNTRKITEAANAAVSENSYMLPHGTRPADQPRATTPANSNNVLNHVSDIPMFADRRPGACGSRSSGTATTGGSTKSASAPRPPTAAGTPGRTPAVAATGVVPLVAASETAKEINARVYTPIAAYTSWLDISAICAFIGFLRLLAPRLRAAPQCRHRPSNSRCARARQYPRGYDLPRPQLLAPTPGGAG